MSFYNENWTQKGDLAHDAFLRLGLWDKTLKSKLNSFINNNNNNNNNDDDDDEDV